VTLSTAGSVSAGGSTNSGSTAVDTTPANGFRS
jgi:hypothetical protein